MHDLQDKWKLEVSKVANCKDQESIQSSTTPDPEYQWESDKLTEDTTNESQEVSPFPAGDHEAHINRRAQNIANTRQNKNINDPQKKYRLGTVSKIFLYKVFGLHERPLTYQCIINASSPKTYKSRYNKEIKQG